MPGQQINPKELDTQTLPTLPHLLLSFLPTGLREGPREGIRVRVGPGLGQQGRAHLVRSALRAGTAWQGLASCAGSKEIEREVGGGGSRIDTCTPPQGSREQTVL